MKIGEIIRYPSQPTMRIELDGRRNWYFETAAPPGKTWSRVKLDSGINCSENLGSKARPNPYIAIRSSPHRFGSEATPWEDVHRPDQGYCRYFGDNKPSRGAASDSLGNRRMLSAFILHSGTKEDREASPPILVYEAVSDSGRTKGQILFHGFGIISRAELIVQRSRGATFPNYVYDIALLDLANESEEFPWAWINARRDPDVVFEESIRLAPQSWRHWVKEGAPSIPRLRRNVVARRIVTEAMQQPPRGTTEYKLLEEIFHFFSGRQHHFEILAEFVTQEILRDQGVTYNPGWITQSSGDGGFDFVGSVDLDPTSPFASSRQVLLGQAKCEKLNRPTNGIHLARLAARLRRGWLGAYVTTSYFSLAVQREVLADRYPMMLIDGRRLAETVKRHLHQNGIDLRDFLVPLVDKYRERIGVGDPELVLNW